MGKVSGRTRLERLSQKVRKSETQLLMETKRQRISVYSKSKVEKILKVEKAWERYSIAMV